MIRFYLGQSPIIGNVHTWMLRRPEDLEYVLAHLPELVGQRGSRCRRLRHAHRSAASKAEIEKFRGLIIATPERYIAQPTSRCPPVPRSWRRAWRRATSTCGLCALRYRCHHRSGGLSRRALREGSLVVNSSQGGGTKDTWVLET